MNEEVLFLSCSRHVIPEVTTSAVQPVGIRNAQSDQLLVFIIPVINYIWTSSSFRVYDLLFKFDLNFSYTCTCVGTYIFSCFLANRHMVTDNSVDGRMGSIFTIFVLFLNILSWESPGGRTAFLCFSCLIPHELLTCVPCSGTWEISPQRDLSTAGLLRAFTY